MLAGFFRQIEEFLFTKIISENYGQGKKRGVVHFVRVSRHNKRKPIRFDENGLELGVTIQFHNHQVR